MGSRKVHPQWGWLSGDPETFTRHVDVTSPSAPHLAIPARFQMGQNSCDELGFIFIPQKAKIATLLGKIKELKLKTTHMASQTSVISVKTPRKTKSRRKYAYSVNFLLNKDILLQVYEHRSLKTIKIRHCRDNLPHWNSPVAHCHFL